MVLRLYNTAPGQKEIFTPLNRERVGVYSCGPTVYDYAHIGNWRTFVINDLLRRTLKLNNYNVTQVLNITDVDDKTIAASREAGVPLGNYTKKYEELFLTDQASLNILAPTILAHATKFIPQMIGLIQKLLETNHAYQTSDGVYFSVPSFADYGKLAKRLDGEEIAEVDDSHNKRNQRDFALWKLTTPADGEVGWEAPFGRGRPGWHIECSAMVLSALGETIDIHTGGQDLIFPHHENEIAQSESVTGKPFSRYWLHAAFLLVDGRKMSKSLNNFYTLKDLKEHGISPLAYRYWLLTGHYRSPVNFTWEAIAGAQTALRRLEDKFVALGEEVGEVDSRYQELFLAKINDDLNLPEALAIISELWDDSQISNEDKKATLLYFDQVLGLGMDKWRELEIPPEVSELLAKREVAREAKDWPLADQIRQKIESRGFEIEDTETGPKLRRK